MLNVSGDEQIFDRALELLRQEPEADRPRLIRWAVNEFERAYDIHLSGLIDEEDDYQSLGDMLLENHQLGYWLRTGNIDRGSLLNAETFEDLIDWLTPGYWDETPLDSSDDDGDVGDEGDHGSSVKVGAVAPKPPGPGTLEEAARGLMEIFGTPSPEAGQAARREEENAGAAWAQVRYDGRLNIYRSAPQPHNEMRFQDFPCLTTVLSNNADTRDYLLIDAGKALSDVPRALLEALGTLELWQVNVEAAPALFFVELLFGESDALRDLRTKGYCFARNRMARQWSDYEKWRMRSVG